MKKLKIYKNEAGDCVLERRNQFNHATKRVYTTTEGLLEALDGYPSDDLSEYELQVQEELWATVINHLQRKN